MLEEGEVQIGEASMYKHASYSALEKGSVTDEG